MQQVRCIGFSQTTWNMKRLPYLNYIGKDGTWNVYHHYSVPTILQVVTRICFRKKLFYYRF